MIPQTGYTQPEAWPSYQEYPDVLAITLQCETCNNLLKFQPGTDPYPKCCGKECRNHFYLAPHEVKAEAKAEAEVERQARAKTERQAKNKVERQARAKAERQAKAKAAILAGDNARLDDIRRREEKARQQKEEAARQRTEDARVKAEAARRKSVEAAAQARREEAEAQAQARRKSVEAAAQARRENLKARREEAKAKAIKREPIIKANEEISAAINSEDGAAVIAAIRANTVSTTYGCWELIHNKDAYPVVMGRGLHRISLEAKEGAPLGVQAAHHKCANNKCVNPDHLQPITERENTAEMFARKSYIDRIAELEVALESVSPGHEALNRIPTSVRTS